jgi:hypothetical protein
MADPAFMQKLVLEQMITVASSLVYEAKVRGNRFWSELDLVATNTLCLAGGEHHSLQHLVCTNSLRPMVAVLLAAV